MQVEAVCDVHASTPLWLKPSSIAATLAKAKSNKAIAGEKPTNWRRILVRLRAAATRP